MPFETTPTAPRRIAVIGGGISGMAASYHLALNHSITLFEAAPHLGGHARTVMAGKHGDQPVDTGFIVFNKVNYPHLTRLFDELNVPIAASDMSFAASLNGGALEYGLRNLDALFAQRRNLLRPAFVRMVRDVLKWNARAATAARDPNQTLRALCDQLRLGAEFRDWYLAPISGAIWSTPTQGILDFPARAFVDFFKNHALLSHTGQHQWFTVRGGSVQYVRRLETALRGRAVAIRKRAPIAAVRRVQGGVEIRPKGAEWTLFDDVVFATHSDQTLAMLADATPQERADLGAVRYQTNTATLHADPRVMPRRKKCWASWVYTEARDQRAGKIDLTYWMNALQPIPADDPLFVTLNSRKNIPEALIHDQVEFAHPVFDLKMMAAVDRIKATNGQANTWFCGAWMRNGFHEDGYASAMDVVQGFAARRPQVAAAQ